MNGKRSERGGAEASYTDSSYTRRDFFDAWGLVAAGGLTSFALEQQVRAEAMPVIQTAQSPVTVAAALIPKLARFVTATRFEDLTAAALSTARAAIMDCAGVAVAGGKEETTQLASRVALEEGGRAEVTLLGQRGRATLSQAAMLNGIAAHAHDFDHSFIQGGQPTSPIIPAALAVAEATGANGKHLIEAYQAGFDVVASLMFAVQGQGGANWHPNGTVGVFGAAAACAKLMQLSQTQTEMALAMAASMASGLQSNFGTMTKPLHVGNAARNGVLAAKLGKAGFTGNPQTLEARNGYLEAFYAGGKPSLAPIDDLAVASRISALERYGVRFKPYPCGGLTHTSIYAAIRLREEHRIVPSAVQRVEVLVPADAAAPLVYRLPKTGLEGKFSMPYLIARALIDGNVTLEAFTNKAVTDAGVLALLERVEMKADPSLQAGTDGSRPATVTILLADGTTHTRHERFPKGSPQTPMTPEELLSKFKACTRGVMNKTSTDRAAELLGKLETLPNVRLLTSLLRET